MFYVHKAYLNAKPEASAQVLTHDVKRCLADSKAQKGLISILSNCPTTAVVLMEGASKIQKSLLDHVKKQFDGVETSDVADRYHVMAASLGLSVTLPFENGRLLSEIHQDVLAFDFDPKPGRREFTMTVMGDANQQ